MTSNLNTAAIRRLIRSRTVRAAALANGAAEDFASSYVAGGSVEQTMPVVQRLQKQGLLVSLAYLPTSDDEAETPGMLLRAIDELGDLAVGTEISVKPSSLGLRDDAPSAAARLADLCGSAQDSGAHVTLEMQGVGEYEPTIGLWRATRERFPMLGLTLPSDIRRSEREVSAIAASGGRVRLCVGSYPVPRSLGFRREQAKSLALVRCIRRAMEGGGYAMVASHDPTIIAVAQEIAARTSVPGFEFQMFYGVRPLEQRRLSDVGYRSRTYLPFGPGWFEYLTTRIAARPRTLYSYLRAVGDKR